MLPLTYVKSGDFVKILKVNGKDEYLKPVVKKSAEAEMHLDGYLNKIKEAGI